jgi:hypothetical protein
MLKGLELSTKTPADLVMLTNRVTQWPLASQVTSISIYSPRSSHKKLEKVLLSLRTLHSTSHTPFNTRGFIVFTIILLEVIGHFVNSPTSSRVPPSRSRWDIQSILGILVDNMQRRQSFVVLRVDICLRIQQQFHHICLSL